MIYQEQYQRFQSQEQHDESPLPPATKKQKDRDSKCDDILWKLWTKRPDKVYVTNVER